jgi:hypothetical protein
MVFVQWLVLSILSIVILGMPLFTSFIEILGLYCKICHSFVRNCYSGTCSHSPYVMSSLTRGWVWLLQLLLALVIAVILRSESHGTHDHILPSQIWDSPSLEGQSLYLYPLGTEWPSYTPRPWVPFLLPPMTQGYGGVILLRLHTR